MTDHPTRNEVKEARLEGELYIRDCPGVMAHTVAVILDALTAAEEGLALEKQEKDGIYEILNRTRRMVGEAKQAAFERGRREVAQSALWDTEFIESNLNGPAIDECVKTVKRNLHSILSPDEPQSAPVCETCVCGTCMDTGSIPPWQGTEYQPCPNCEECSECGGDGKISLEGQFHVPCNICNGTGRVLNKETE